MFSFNFGSMKTESNSSSEEECESVTSIDPTDFTELHSIISNNKSIFFGDDIQINTLSKENLIALLGNDNDFSIQKAETSHSDLLPGIYEGGLKIWECTYDLSHYILKHKRLTLKGKIVLDLGCGAGLLGILAKKLGAKTVDFQDFNSGVIKNLTIPNVLINFPTSEDVGFWCGDWSGFRQHNKYDVILTSETIYNIQNYSKLHRLFRENLKPDGIIYLASKSYYFGVGGSVNEFCDFLLKKNVFKFQKVFCMEDGVKRDILEIRFKEDDEKGD